MTRLLLLIALVAAPFASADILTLKAGDRLTGSLATLNDGVLSFRTKLAGKVYYPADEVAGISTDQFVLVSTRDNVVVPGRLRYHDGEQTVTNRGQDEARALDLAEVVSIETLPESQQTTADASDPRISASFETGYRARTGAEDYSGPTASIEVRGRTDALDITGRLDTEYVGDAGSFSRFYEAGVDAQLHTSSIWEPFVTVNAERNRDKAIELRGDITAGVARRFIDTDRQRLDGRAGLGVAFERFDIRPLRDDQGRRARERDPVKRDEDLNLHLSLRYTRALFRSSYIEESLTVLPSLSDIGDFRAAWNSAVHVPITRNIRLKFDLTIDYEDDLPYNDLDDWRTSLGASFRVDF